MRSFITLTCLCGTLSSAPLRAEFSAPHLALVGVISDGAGGGQGVAVLRDLTNKRTLMLRRGEALPDGSGYVVKSIERKEVLVARGTQIVRLEHVAAKADENEVKKDGEGEAETARSGLERLLRPLSRRVLVEPEDGDGEGLTFERLKAELLDAPDAGINEIDENAEAIRGEDHGH